MVTGMTIGDYGCAITTLCVLLQNFLDENGNVYNLTPDVMVDMIKPLGGLDVGGNLIWPNIGKLFPDVTFLSRDYVEKPDFNAQLITSGAALQRAVKASKMGCNAMLRVKLGSNPLKANHWVLGALTTDAQLAVVDPWTGDTVLFKDRYGDPSTQIFGLARFFGKAVNAADPDYRSAAWMAWQIKNGLDVENNARTLFDNLSIY